MQFRSIAKAIIYARGFKTMVTAEDGQTYGEHKDFTPGQVGKAQAAVNTIAASFAEKWDIPKKDR